MEFRYYQEESITATLDDYEQSGPSGSGLLSIATGAGKTVIAAELSRRMSNPVLFLVHREELAVQAIEKYQAVWKGVDIGLVMAKTNELGRTVTVASVQTVANEKRLSQLLAANNYKMVIQDECFPAGTMVDGKMIEDIKVGDYVNSYNHQTNKIEKRRVNQKSKTEYAGDLIQINYGHRCVICTPNHPVYVKTETGEEKYLLAENIKEGMFVYERTISNDSKMCFAPGMFGVGNIFNKKGSVRNLFTVIKRLLLRILQEKIYFSNSVKKFTGNKLKKQGQNFSTHERKQPNAKKRDKTKSYKHTEGNWAQTHDSGWKREGANGSTINFVERIKKMFSRFNLGIRKKCFYSRSVQNWILPKSLQAGHRLSESQPSNRSGWVKSLRTGKARARQEKRKDFELIRVDSVEVQKQGSASKSGDVYSENRTQFVYNLSVEGNHNYFANDILVHNCHHSPSPIFARVLNSVKAYRLGLTATPVRADGVGMDSLFSKVLYEYTIIDGIKDGYLSDIQARRIDIGINLDGVKVTAGDFAAQAISDVMCKDEVMQVIFEKWSEYAINRKTIAFCCDVNHAKEMSAYFSRQGISAAWISGEMDSDTRKHTLKQYSKGNIQYLCNCMILTEGWDEPAVDCVVMARPTSSQVLYSQAIGRGTRLFPGKDNLLVLDVVGNTRKHQLMQVPNLTGVPYPKVEKIESIGGGADKIIKSVRGVLVARDEAVDIYKKAPRTFSWIRSGDKFGLQLGFNHYLQVRPTDGGYEAVNCYLKGWKYTETVIHQSHMIDLCISVAEEQAENLASRSTNNVLEYQTVDKTLKITLPSPKQIALLNKYGIPVPPTAIEAGRAISRAFFDFFLKSAECTADSSVRKLIKQEKYANRLSCSITLEQIDSLKVIEAGKIMKFYV